MLNAAIGSGMHLVTRVTWYCHECGYASRLKSSQEVDFFPAEPEQIVARLQVANLQI